MASKHLNWTALEPALRKLKKEELAQVLRAAYQALPSSCVVSVFGAYVVLRRVTPRPPPVRAWHRVSCWKLSNDSAPRAWEGHYRLLGKGFFVSGSCLHG